MSIWAGFYNGTPVRTIQKEVEGQMKTYEVRLCQTNFGRRHFFWQCGYCGIEGSAPSGSNTRMREWLYNGGGRTEATTHVCATDEGGAAVRRGESPAELLLLAAAVRSLTAEEIAMIKAAIHA